MIPRAADCTSFPTTITVRDATVGPLFGHLQSVGLGHADVLVWQTESLGSNLAENGIGSLAEFRAGNQHANTAIGAALYAYHRTQITLARSGESCAVQESGDAHALS